MTEIIPKDDPRARAAIAEINGMLGWDIEAVMQPDWWRVSIIDGRAEILGSAKGMRCMARFAPRPDAVEVCEEIIATLHYNGGDR